jgi:hypothetical protein
MTARTVPATLISSVVVTPGTHSRQREKSGGHISAASVVST